MECWEELAQRPQHHAGVTRPISGQEMAGEAKMACRIGSFRLYEKGMELRDFAVGLWPERVEQCLPDAADDHSPGVPEPGRNRFSFQRGSHVPESVSETTEVIRTDRQAPKDFGSLNACAPCCREAALKELTGVRKLPLGCEVMSAGNLRGKTLKVRMVERKGSHGP